jgi:hypothetical protein
MGRVAISLEHAAPMPSTTPPDALSSRQRVLAAWLVATSPSTPRNYAAIRDSPEKRV